MLPKTIQIRNVNMCSKSKIIDYANKKEVRYGQSDASLTVEASLVLPLVLLMMLAFLSWIQFFQEQESGMRTLHERLRQVSTAAVVAEQDLPKQVVLTDVQTLHFPLGLLPVEKHFARQAGLRTFTGRRYGSETNESKEEQMVYLAETGSVYHSRETCTHLKLSVKRVEQTALAVLRNRAGAIYYACEVCTEGKVLGKEEMVYITEEGNRYHLMIGCRGLLRRISMVPLQEAIERGRKPCSRCGKEEG